MKPETTIDRSTQRSLTRKLLLLIAAFVIPLSVLSIYFLLTGLNKDVKFAEHELRGNTYQRKLEPLLRMLPEQRLLAGKGAGGDAAAAARLPQSEAAVERAFTDLAATDAKLGGLLLMTVEGLKAANMPDVTVATVRAKWEAARKGPAEEADKNLGAIIADVRQMIVHVGNKSNLILDPDLDSYYLMDVTLVALPQNQDRLGALAAFFSTLPALPAPEQSRELAARMALLREADLDRIAADVATALAEDKAFYGENAKMQSSYAAAMAEYRAAIEKVLTLASAEQIASAELVAATEAARTESFRFWDTSVDHLDALLQSRLDAFQATLIRSLAIALLGIAAAALAAFFIIRNLARSFGRMLDEQAAARTTAEQEKLRLQEQIQSLLMVVSDGSDGKLGVRAKVTEGALGNVADALNLMFENVGDLISSAQAASDKVAMAARQISATTLDLTAGSETQSAEVAQTASGVQALNAQAETVVRNCVAATEAVANARSAAENGALAVREVITGMHRIRDNVQINAKKIKRLGDRSMEISGIVKSIGEISAKTDMLALNASMEAARAGEQGKGFSVIAEQVRSLAERTRTLTAEIERLVGSIQSETAEAVHQMETQTGEVENGSKQVEMAGQALERIVQASGESSALVAEINASAGQQAVRTSAMLTAVATIRAITEGARTKVLETSTTSDQLTELSTRLNRELAKFSVNGTAGLN